MAGVEPVDERCGIYFGRTSLDGSCQLVLGKEELDVGKELEASQQFLQVRSELLGELAKDANDFPALVGLQFADAVVGLHYFCRLDEDRLSRCTLVVNDALDAPLQGRSHGDDETAVAHGRCHVLLYQSISLCRFEDACKGTADAALGPFQFPSDSGKLAACLVLDASVLVENLLKAAGDGVEREDTFGKLLESRERSPRLSPDLFLEGRGVITLPLQRGVGGVLYDFHPGVKGAQGSQEFPHRLFFKVCTFDADAMDVAPQVEEVLLGLLGSCLQDVAQFGKLLMQGRDGRVVREELHGIHTLMPQGTETVAVQHRPHLVEAYLLF